MEFSGGTGQLCNSIGSHPGGALRLPRSTEVRIVREAAYLSIAWLTLGSLSFSTVSAGDIQSYLTGELADLELLETPVSLASHVITYPDGTEHALGEKKGSVLLVNLWSKSCLPCRAEMKHLSTLQADLGDDRFEVVALPIEKRTTKSARKILQRWEAENLQPYVQDPAALAQVLYDQGLFEDTKVSFVLPTTYLVNANGIVLAVQEGFLNWDTPDVRALITVLKEGKI